MSGSGWGVGLSSESVLEVDRRGNPTVNLLI